MWRAIRDVCVAGINKGQGPVILLLLLLIVVAARMPAKDLGAVAREVLALLERGWFLGWILSAVLIVCWWRHATYTRRMFGREIDRIGAEKSDLQQALHPDDSEHKLKTIREE